MLNINDNAFDLEITRVESPFPIADMGHKGQFRIKNQSGEANTITGYLATFTANIHGKEIILKVDDSSEHTFYSRVTGGTFLFPTEKSGICIDEINLSDFPIELTKDQEEFIHFYLVDIDILKSLQSFGITNAATAKEKGCTFRMKMEVKLAQSYPSWNLITEKPIEVR